MYLNSTNNTIEKPIETPFCYVDQIKNSSYLYDVKNLSSGILNFGATGTWLPYYVQMLSNSKSNTYASEASWALEIGQVADQSFGGHEYLNNSVP